MSPSEHGGDPSGGAPPVAPPRVLRIMSDWSLWPFYVQLNDGLGYELSHPETVQELLGLPAEVTDAVMAWDELFQQHLDWDDPASTEWPSADYARDYVEQGRAVCRLLRRHLPDDVVVEYRADDYEIRPEFY